MAKTKADALAVLKPEKAGLAGVESVNMSPSKGVLSRMEDAKLIKDTISVCAATATQMNLATDYLRECQKRFDNRGKGRGKRVVAGYKGWSDFCERGLGRSIRSVQRMLLEAMDPIAAETRREDARIPGACTTFTNDSASA